jgi:hypothetical protein
LRICQMADLLPNKVWFIVSQRGPKASPVVDRRMFTDRKEAEEMFAIHQDLLPDGDVGDAKLYEANA